MSLRSVLMGLSVALLPQACWGVDHVTAKRDGQSVEITGKVLVEAADGGLLVLDREGILQAVQPDELVRRSQDETPFTPMQADELQTQLLAQLPAGFRVHTTAHYLICYNTSPVYAEWCGALFERLYWAFSNYWERRGLKLRDPPMPLVALVFSDKESYERYARTELGDAAASVVGFYSLRTNRVTMYDLTGLRGLQGARRSFTSTAQINALLQQPGAERTVATVIHEATHQLAYNCGLHTRYTDIPLWVSEGLAVYFETPDLRSAKGWRDIGGVHRSRLADFRRYLASRPPESLRSLIADDRRFRETTTAVAAYAEAWALNYYLIRRHSDLYVKYLQRLADRTPMVYDTADERVAAFTEVIGEDLKALDQDFLRYMSAVR